MDWMRPLLVLASISLGCSFDSPAAAEGSGGGSETQDAGTAADSGASTSSSASQGGATTQDAASASGSDTSASGSDTSPSGSETSASGSDTSAGSTETTTTAGTSAADSSGGSGGSTGTPDLCRDACDPNASCDDRSGEPVCVCEDDFFGDGTTCTALALPTARVELPCVDSAQCGTIGCAMEETDEQTVVLVGDPTVTYAVTLRFRGVIEQKTYTGGGTQDGFFHPNATPDGGGYNLFALEVAAPAGTYYLNSGSSGINYCFPLDEQHVVEVQGGSDLRLFAHNGFDVCGLVNVDDGGTPIVVPDVPPAPAPYDGQFIQIDVVDISPV